MEDKTAVHIRQLRDEYGIIAHIEILDTPSSTDLGGYRLDC